MCPWRRASRALNGESASADTVQRVTQAARDLSYVPDARAQSLKLGATRQLVFAVADVGNHVYVEMMRAFEDTVRSHGYRVLISSIGSRVDAEVELLRSLQRGYADGVMLSPLRVDEDLLAELGRLRVPAVIVGLLPPEAPYDNVGANSALGVSLAVQHLIVRGRGQIGFVNGPPDTTPGRVRGQAFVDACRAAGTSSSPEHRAVAEDFTFAAGRQAAQTLLDRTAELDAVVAANDLIAAGVYHAAAERGLRVPDDLAVVGMDDSALAQQLLPNLTSVDLGSAERGRRAAELLLARLRDPQRTAQHVVVQPSLVTRKSTASAGLTDDVEPEVAR